MESVNNAEFGGHPSRRRVAASAAWALPSVAIASAAPAFAGSTDGIRILACPDVSTLSFAADGAPKLSLAYDDRQLALAFTLLTPSLTDNQGLRTTAVDLLTFDATPYFVDGSVSMDSGGAPGFSLTGPASNGYTLANNTSDLRLDTGFASNKYPYLNGGMAGLGGASVLYLTPPPGTTPQIPTGCLSFRFQLGYAAGSNSGSGMTDSPPVPTVAGTYCDYYFNSCFDSSGAGSNSSITTSPLYT